MLSISSSTAARGRDHLDDHDLMTTLYGWDNPHAFGPAEEAVAVQRESRFQELKRLRRKNALRRE